MNINLSSVNDMKEGWKKVKLGEVCDIICGRDYKHVQDENGEYPIYGSGGIMGYSSEFRCPENCTIIGRKGSINNPIFVETKFWNVDTAFALNADKHKILPKFLYYFCKEFDFNKLNVAVTLPSLRRTDVLEITIPLPPIETQRQIVSELNLLGTIITKKNEQLKELDKLAQSTFYDMFGDPVTNERGWDVKTIGEIATTSIGLTYKPDQIVDEKAKDVKGTIVLRSSNIQDNEIDLKDIVRVNATIKEKLFVREGDILMCSRNGSFKLVGKTAMIPKLEEPMTFGAFMTIIRSDYNVYLKNYFLCSDFRHQLKTAQTATINQITVKMLNDIKLPIPPISLQQTFAEKIEAIEKQKTLIKQSITEVQTLLDATMDKYFG